MARSKNKFIKREVEEVDAILPFMSLLLIIIPLLISNLAFYHFKVIQASIPGAAPASPDEPTPTPKKDKMVMATLLLEPSVLQLSILDEDNGSTIKKFRNKNDPEVATKMFDELNKFRAQYPKLDTIIVTTHEEIKYDNLVRVLDKFKQRLPKDHNRDPSSYDEKVDKEYFKYKMVMLPATADLSLPD
ncbi:MAG: hypothetical protein H6621_03570 [Halobacteriovoraceae bacterium]|nr:hypothetical protein [Halobacteriovoraceae bacterium]MCB9094127.1 hypothetical protein [Halobacteriovoraceae bacterium]